jgi:hypothetical protein
LTLYRRIAHQYRRADLGLTLRDQALASIARLEQRAVQRAAN